MDAHPPDWASLLEPYRDQSGFSTTDGQNLLARVIGNERIEDAVDHFIRSPTGSNEALRMAFRVLQPVVATNRCVSLLWTDLRERERSNAVDLLKVTCRPSDLDEIEALLNDDDPVRQHAAMSVLFQLRWSIDLDTDQTCRVIRRCVELEDGHAVRSGLQLASGAFDEIADRTPNQELLGVRLTVGEIQAMFAKALASDDRLVVEEGLNSCPLGLVEALRAHIESLATGTDPYTAAMATELLEGQRQ